jgi:hypothetical protein
MLKSLLGKTGENFIFEPPFFCDYGYNIKIGENFFDNRSTNASAESFNAKIKSFRATLRGVNNIPYFLFRLKNIYA